MEYREVKPLPVQCQKCNEDDCYNCDYAAARWRLPRKTELQVRKKMLTRAILRLQRQLQEIQEELDALEQPDV